MAFPFKHVCDLLEVIYNLSLSGKKERIHPVITSWFDHHRSRIDNLSVDGGAALLSILIPEQRTDRVYWIQTARLERIFIASQGLGRGRAQELCRYKVPGSGSDLADCVERILQCTPNVEEEVDILDIDDTLNRIASKVRFSSPKIRSLAKSSPASSNQHELEPLYRSLGPREAKWLTRLVLKDYRPLVVDPSLILKSFHHLLPSIRLVVEEFHAALAVLRKIQDADHSLSPSRSTLSARQRILQEHLKPKLGIKVGRPYWLKGRSIQHCLDISVGSMSVERKYDGEYCQIHINLKSGRHPVQIFSKSGKDSTEDRKDLQGAIMDSLLINKPGCKLSKGCILEGELLAYSDQKKRILPFEKIRNHVTRRGLFLNSDMDSQPKPGEHLMIVYYDVFMIDNESLLGMRHSERYSRLRDLITCRTGYAEVVERQVIDANDLFAPSTLRKLFVAEITSRGEGLVLKPDEPFLDISQSRRAYAGCPIKLKKQYLYGLGDAGDFAVVAARYDARKAKCFQLPNVKWTHFFIGCLENREYESDRPRFQVVAVVEFSEILMKTFVYQCDTSFTDYNDVHAAAIHVPYGICQGRKPTMVFTNPPICDVGCFSYEKPGNVGFYVPRFPSVTKFHFDRGLKDVLTMDELQVAAVNALEEVSQKGYSQEQLELVAKLEMADPKRAARGSMSQQTVTSKSTSQSTNPRSLASELSPGPINQVNIRGLQTPNQQAQSCPTFPPYYPTPLDPSALFPSRPSQERAVDHPATHKRCRSQTTTSPVTPRGRKRANKSYPKSSSPHGPVPQSRADRTALSQISGNSSPDIRPSSQDMPPRHSPEVIEVIEITDDSEPEPSRSVPKTKTLQASQQENEVEVARSECTETEKGPGSTESPRVILQSHGEPYGCKIAGDDCPFRSHAVLLPPFLADTNHISDLQQHGITHYVTSINEWTQHTTPDDSDNQSDCDLEQLQRKKICLVDMNDRDAAKQYLKDINDEPLIHGNGEREWIVAYDWRILDAVTRWEELAAEGKDRARLGDPWQRWTVGYV